jgi:hypothetical protein
VRRVALFRHKIVEELCRNKNRWRYTAKKTAKAEPCGQRAQKRTAAMYIVHVGFATTTDDMTKGFDDRVKEFGAHAILSKAALTTAAPVAGTV